MARLTEEQLDLVTRFATGLHHKDELQAALLNLLAERKDGRRRLLEEVIAVVEALQPRPTEISLRRVILSRLRAMQEDRR